MPKGWDVKLITNNDNNVFQPNETIFIGLNITNEEGGEDIESYNLTLYFVLDDNLCETPIVITIPFRTQYGKEFLSSYYFDNPLIYDKTKGKTNTIRLYLVYDVFGALKNYKLCNNTIDSKCYLISTEVTEVPDGCNVKTNYKYFTSNQKAEYLINCTRKPKKEDKIKICSGVIWKINATYGTMLCGVSGICEDHCSYINLVSETYEKDFDFNLNYYNDNLQYKLKVGVKNTGTVPIKGITIKLQDLTGGNCGLTETSYRDSDKTLSPGQIFEKVFMFNPTGLCKIKVNVTADDPISKEKDIVVNPFSENENKQVIKTDNPSLYPLYLILVGVISLLIGLYYTKKELE